MIGGAALLPRALRDDLEAAIAASTPSWDAWVTANGEHAGAAALPLAVKYLPAQWATTYRAPNRGLFIGNNTFTWGRAVYVTGVEEPLSTAIYGRAGVVARFDPSGWRCFDARPPGHRDLYLRWLHAQVAYSEAVLTVHSGHWLQTLRNLFREQFSIDVVLFAPDEVDSRHWYTSATDTWLAVSEWTSRSSLAAGYSTRFHDARMTILVEEEFAVDDPGLMRTPMLTISNSSPAVAGLPARVRRAYAAGDIERVPS